MSLHLIGALLTGSSPDIWHRLISGLSLRQTTRVSSFRRLIPSPRERGPIDNNSTILVDGGLQVKLVRYYSIEDLLGNDSEYKDAFANGVLTHTFLNVNDYHRYHFASWRKDCGQ